MNTEFFLLKDHTNVANLSSTSNTKNLMSSEEKQKQKCYQSTINNIFSHKKMHTSTITDIKYKNLNLL